MGATQDSQATLPNKGDMGAWDEGNPREAADVRREARLTNLTVHFGRFCEFCHEKGSELADGDPVKKMKGRAVLLGDNVRDQDFNWAEFCELGSSPPSMEAAKPLDAMGSFPGYVVETGDARGAYTQSLLKGVATWVTLPENRWPKHWIGKFLESCSAPRPCTLRTRRRRNLLGRPLRRHTDVNRIHQTGRRMARSVLARENEIGANRLR